MDGYSKRSQKSVVESFNYTAILKMGQKELL